MKILLIGFSLAFISLLTSNVSCKSKSDTTSATVKRDTTLTLAAYLGYGLKGYQEGVVRKIIVRDTLMWVGKDSSTMKKEANNFTYFIVPIWIPIKDSITAKTFGIMRLDTVILRNMYAPQEYVVDGVTNWDSAIAKLSKYRDTTNVGADSSVKR